MLAHFVSRVAGYCRTPTRRLMRHPGQSLCLSYHHPVPLATTLAPRRWRPYSISAGLSNTLSDRKGSDATSSDPAMSSSQPKQQQPSYDLTFTCKPCGTRSSDHVISKQAYHKGSVLITCPNCKARHVIADHLKIFSEEKFTLEEFMKNSGGLFKRGRVEGDMEFWDDGTVHDRGTKSP